MRTIIRLRPSTAPEVPQTPDKPETPVKKPMSEHAKLRNQTGFAPRPKK